VDAGGAVVIRRCITRAKLFKWFVSTQPPYGSAAEWAPSTASNSVIRRCRLNVRFARKPAWLERAQRER
jgi:hypothetical protein